jgi:hypothetical protein
VGALLNARAVGDAASPVTARGNTRAAINAARHEFTRKACPSLR